MDGWKDERLFSRNYIVNPLSAFLKNEQGFLKVVRYKIDCKIKQVFFLHNVVFRH